MITEMMLGAAVVFSATTEYDELGRVIAERGNNGQEYRYEYDQEGRRTASTDAQGRRTTMEYDARGRLTKVTDPAGKVTTFSYDKGDRITQVVDPRGKSTSYSYDGFGQLWSQVSPDTGKTAFAYDAVGQRVSMTRADNAVTQYGYDGLGRLTSVTAGGQRQAFIYDACSNGKGRLCKAESPLESATFAYTPQGAIDHAERRRRAREGIALVLAADEGVDLSFQRDRRGLHQRRDGQGQQAGQACQGTARRTRGDEGRQSAH